MKWRDVRSRDTALLRCASAGDRARRGCSKRSTDVSTLTPIRHGQAQAFQRETAALSSLGEWQARKLAEFWARQNVSFDEVWCGSLPRQARTAEVVAECMRAANRPWPTASVEPAWNEYDATGVLRNLAPADPQLAALAA